MAQLPWAPGVCQVAASELEDPNALVDVMLSVRASGRDGTSLAFLQAWLEKAGSSMQEGKRIQDVAKEIREQLAPPQVRTWPFRAAEVCVARVQRDVGERRVARVADGHRDGDGVVAERDDVGVDDDERGRE